MQLIDKINKLKEDLANRIIQAVPENPNIERLEENPNCFIVMSSELRRTDNWTPEYHDWKYLAEKIAEKIKKISIEKLDKFIQEMISRKTVKLYSDQNYRQIIPPEVIEIIKKEYEDFKKQLNI